MARSLAKVLASLLVIATFSGTACAFLGPTRAVMEGIWATNNAILVSSGTGTTTSSVTINNLRLNYLTANQCVQTNGTGGLTTSGAQCGTGSGGGGSSALAVFGGGIVVSSPTSIINFSTMDFTTSLLGGGTAQVALNGTNSNAFIRNSSILQAGSTFYVSSGTIMTTLGITSTIDPSLIAGAYGGNANESNILNVRWAGTITGATTQLVPGFFFIDNTGTNNLPLADGVAMYAMSRDHPGGRINLQGGESRTLAQGTAVLYLGHKDLIQWVAANGQTTGTTSELVAHEFGVIVSSADGTGISTGSLVAYAIWDAPVGQGSPGNSWTNYGPAWFPNWWNGSLALGGAFQDATFHVNVTSVNTPTSNFAMLITTGAFNSGSVITKFSISTFGVVNMPAVTASRFLKTSATFDVVGSTIQAGDLPPDSTAYIRNDYGTNSLLASTSFNVSSGAITNITSAKGVSISADAAFAVVKSAAGTATAVMAGGYSQVKNTYTGVDSGGHAIGQFNYYTDVTGTLEAGYAEEGRTNSIALGQAGQLLVGDLGLVTHSGPWNGNSSGLVARVEHYAADGVTPLSTGTINQIYIPAPVGSSASGIYNAILSESTGVWVASGAVTIGGDGLMPNGDTRLYVNARTNSGVLPSVVFLSGRSTAYQWLEMGRTGDDLDMGVAATANAFMLGTAAGDPFIRATGASNKVVIGANSGQGMLYVSSIGVTTNGYTVTSGSTTTGGFTTTQHINARSSAPSLSSCGATPAITGSDVAGTITEGTGSPTGCTITFNAAWTNTPFCVAQTTSTVTTAAVTAISASQFTVTTSASIPSDTINYVCIGRD